MGTREYPGTRKWERLLLRTDEPASDAIARELLKLARATLVTAWLTFPSNTHFFRESLFHNYFGPLREFLGALWRELADLKLLRPDRTRGIDSCSAFGCCVDHFNFSLSDPNSKIYAMILCDFLDYRVGTFSDYCSPPPYFFVPFNF